VAEWGGGCPVMVWDGPYKYRCSIGGDGGVCAYHGRFAEKPAPRPEGGAMLGHDEGCRCVRCNPERCADCGTATVHLSHGRCSHRRACEARQMMNGCARMEDVIAHAQGATSRAEPKR
jgi:hypothetical protein